MDSLKDRSYAKARIIVKNKIQEKVDSPFMVERLLVKKQPLINEIARKIYERNLNLNESFSEAFTSASGGVTNTQSEPAAISSTSKGEGTRPTETIQIRPKGDLPVKRYVKLHRSFNEEMENETAVYKSIVKKAEKHGIDVDVLGEVYNRGLNSWSPDNRMSQDQYAFSRVNSFINKGKSYFEEDADLQTEGAIKAIAFDIDQMRDQDFKKKYNTTKDNITHLLGNTQNNPNKRLQGTNSLTRAYKTDTPHQPVSEDRHDVEAIPRKDNARKDVEYVGRKDNKKGNITRQSEVQHKVVDEELNSVFKEAAFSADRKGVPVPPYDKVVPDTEHPGNTKTITIRQTRTKSAPDKKKIVGQGSDFDGKAGSTKMTGV